MATMTRSQFAQHRHVTKGAVTQWATAGRLVFAPDGAVDVEASETRLAATVNTRGGKRVPGATGGVQGEPPVVNGRAPVQYELDADTLTGARTKQANARAGIDELEFKERSGLLVDRARYDAAIADAVGPILAHLDTLSVRAAPGLAGQTDIRRIQDLIDDEVIKVRQDIADTLRALTARGTMTRQ